MVKPESTVSAVTPLPAVTVNSVRSVKELLPVPAPL